MNTASDPVRICVTGAAGQIAYALLPMLANGGLFPEKPVVLQLLDIPDAKSVLDGVVMELDDLAAPLLHGVIATSDPNVAFKDADIAILAGAFPRKQGMERKELLARNAAIFREHGTAIDSVAKKSCKILVVGNPANTNALITSWYAKSIPRENITCLTRLDHNRAVSMIAKRLNEPAARIRDVIIWGNHSSTQFPDLRHASLTDGTKQTHSVIERLQHDLEWAQNSFVTAVQQRGAAVINARKQSSAMSAAKAIVDHLRDWCLGTDQIVSMGILSTGDYDVPEGIVFSFPVRCSKGQYTVQRGLAIDAFAKEKIAITAKELVEERHDAKEIVSSDRA